MRKRYDVVHCNQQGNSKKLPENLHDIVEKFLCEDIDEKKDCMMGDCLRGSVTNLSLSILVDPVVRAMIVMFPMMLRVLTLI